MAEKELIDFFVEGKKMGNSLNQLKKILLKNGWAEKEVQEAFDEAILQENLFEKKNELILNKKKLNKNSKKRFVPVHLRYVAIFHFFIAIFWFFILTLNDFSRYFFGSFIGSSSNIFNFLFGLIFGSMPLIVGIGLWMGKNTWRIFSIFFSFIFLVLLIFLFFEGWIFSLIGIFIFIYIIFSLIFDRKIRNYFS